MSALEWPPHPPYPNWLPDADDYAVEQARWRHEQALYSSGEYAMFILLWRIQDHESGLVDRCPDCFVAEGKIAEAYGQPARRKCPTCYGTTFEGGIRAKLVRPSLWDFNETDQRVGARGEILSATASIQSTEDFRLRTNDYIFRGDGTRWQMRTLSAQHLRTGFQMPVGRTNVGYNFGICAREDESSVAYIIPPSEAVLKALIDVSGTREPVDFTAAEEVNGPLL